MPSTDVLLARLRVYADDVAECVEELDELTEDGWPIERLRELGTFKRRERALEHVELLTYALRRRRVPSKTILAAGGSASAIESAEACPPVAPAAPRKRSRLTKRAHVAMAKERAAS